MNPEKSDARAREEEGLVQSARREAACHPRIPLFPCPWSYRLTFAFPNYSLFTGKPRKPDPSAFLAEGPEGQREIGTVVLLECLDGPGR